MARSGAAAVPSSSSLGNKYMPTGSFFKPPQTHLRAQVNMSFTLNKTLPYWAPIKLKEGFKGNDKAAVMYQMTPREQKLIDSVLIDEEDI